MSPESCPRYESCNAPVCPLDARWQFRHYGRGEAVCGFVLEAVKPGGAEVVRRQLPPELATAILEAAPEMGRRFPAISHRLDRARSQGSRIRSAWAARKGEPRNALNVA